jgi:hypothetical protein
VPVSPVKLEGITTHDLIANKLKAFFDMGHLGNKDLAGHIRLALTSGTRTGFS